MADRPKSNKVSMNHRVSPDCKAKVKKLAERLGVHQVAVLEEAVAIYEEVLDAGVQVVAARRWAESEETPE